MTDTLFPVDEEANDRLLLQEAARREDLINQAVESFAPHLAGKPGVQVIHIYSSNSSLRKAVREICGSKVIVVEHVQADGRQRKGVNEVQHDGIFIPIPAKADIVASRSGLNTRMEWLAARLGATPVVLPEGAEWLQKVLDRKGVLTIVGAEQAKQ